MLMNGEHVHSFAKQLAGRIREEAAMDIDGQAVLALQLVYSREPAGHDVADAVEFLRAQAEFFRSNGENKHKNAKTAAKDQDPEFQALESFCHALLSSNAFLYVD
jgi:hypothetical protein